MAVDLKNHPGLNPEYFEQMEARRSALAYNRFNAYAGVSMKVPPQPNKYVPHIGAKQRAKGADK